MLHLKVAGYVKENKETKLKFEQLKPDYVPHNHPRSLLHHWPAQDSIHHYPVASKSVLTSLYEPCV